MLSAAEHSSNKTDDFGRLLLCCWHEAVHRLCLSGQARTHPCIVVALDATSTLPQLQAHLVPYLTRQRVVVVVLQHLQQLTCHCTEEVQRQATQVQVAVGRRASTQHLRLRHWVAGCLSCCTRCQSRGQLVRTQVRDELPQLYWLCCCHAAAVAAAVPATHGHSADTTSVPSSPAVAETDKPRCGTAGTNTTQHVAECRGCLPGCAVKSADGIHLSLRNSA
jgi:hypothetical protein